MSIEARQITVGGIQVDVVRRPIKNLHLGVYPPNGRIRVAAPLAVSDDAVRLAVVTRMAWIKRQRAKFEAQPRQSERKYVSGETHYFLGQRYRLRMIEGVRAGRVEVRNSRSIDLHVRTNTNVAGRERILMSWYRDELRSRVAPLVAKWSAALEVAAPTCGIKRMKTKWGTCNIEARRIWLNLELIKKPIECLEYVIVHELTHFFERNHNDRFVAVLDQNFPRWRSVRDELNALPLSQEVWRLASELSTPAVLPSPTS